MALTKKQIEKIEEFGWEVTEEHTRDNRIYAYELSKKTRCGLPFYIMISYETPLEDLEEYVEFFDDNEIVQKLQDRGGLIPPRYELWLDVKDIEENLQELVKELRGL